MRWPPCVFDGKTNIQRINQNEVLNILVIKKNKK